MPAQRRTLGFVAAALASSLWGCGFYFGKIALAEMNVGVMVLYRFAFGALGLLPLLVLNRDLFRAARFTAAEWRTLLIAAFLGVPLQFLVQFKGLSLTTVSHASLMVGTLPVILAVGATLFANERMNLLGWLALSLSTTGAALIAFGHQAGAATGIHIGPALASPIPAGPTLTGDLLIVLSMFVALFWILMNKSLMQRHGPIVVTVYGVVAGTLMLAVCVPLFFGPVPLHGISLKAWAALAASGLLCTSATTLLWNWGMTQVPASQAGVLLNMEPLIGSLLGVFLLQEHLGTLAWIGGAMILTAAITLTTRPAPQSPILLEDPGII